MEFISNHLLSLILFIPTLAALLILALPSSKVSLIRWFALTASLLAFGLALTAWSLFDLNKIGFQFQEQAPWYTYVNASYHIGVDGISLTMWC